MKHYDNKKVYKVFIDDEQYQSCSICDEFFVVNGNNAKYCDLCKGKMKKILERERREQVENSKQ